MTARPQDKSSLESPAGRPADSSSGLIGHSQAVEFFGQAWERGRLSHAYLLVGPAGVGKRALAEWLAESVLGQASLKAHPDFMLVERGDDPKTGKPRNAIVIDQVHALRGKMALGPMLAGGWKVAILSGADLMNEAAANALLKTLEEPHRHSLMILTATSAESVMPTIRSRCQIVRLNRVPRQEIIEGLRQRGLPDERAGLLARLANGCPGRALELAARPEALAELTERRQALAELIEAELTERWQGMEGLIPSKAPFNEARQIAEEALGLMAELLRDAVVLAVEGTAERIVHADLADRLAAWPAKYGLDRLNAALAETDLARRRLAANVSPKTALGLVAGSLSGL